MADKKRDHKLSDGFLEQVFNGQALTGSSKIVLQVLQFQEYTSSKSLCFRLECSDGKNKYFQCGLTNDLSQIFERDCIPEKEDTFPIIQLLDYNVAKSNTKQTLVIYKFKFLENAKLQGNPVELKLQNASAAAPPQFPTFEHKGMTGKRRATYEMQEPHRRPSVDPTEPILVGIDGLQPRHTKGSWKTHGLVSSVDKLRKVSNGTNDCFSFALTDGKNFIKVTGFGGIAVKYSRLIAVNSYYFISGENSRIQIDKARKYSVINNVYEIILDEKCTIVEDKKPEKITISLSRTPLNLLPENHGKVVDILAYVDEVEDVQMVSGSARRYIRLIDETATTVSVTLWRDKAEECDWQKSDIKAIKNVLVQKYNDKISLSFGTGTRVLDVVDDIPKSFENWYALNRNDAKVHSISFHDICAEEEIRTFAIFKDPNLDPNMIFTVYGYIAEIPTKNVMYQSCPTQNCLKKVTQREDGLFWCDKCQIAHEICKNRYLVSMEISDNYTTAWVTLFDELSFKFFGISADDLAALLNLDDGGAAYRKIFHSKLFTFHAFRCKGKMEIYNDAPRLKFSLYNILTPNYNEYGHALETALTRLELLNNQA